MNPHEEKELNREEGENLLERLTRSTAEDSISWTCTRFVPLFLYREDGDPVEQAQLSQDLTASTQFGELTLTASVSETLCLNGTGWPTLVLTIRSGASKAQTRYSDFRQESIIRFLDTLLPRLISSELVSTMCKEWVSPFKYEDPEVTGHPVSRLCERLYRERRHLDFHNTVCHPCSLKMLLAEIN